MGLVNSCEMRRLRAATAVVTDVMAAVRRTHGYDSLLGVSLSGANKVIRHA
jgi:hypothetical protein